MRVASLGCAGAHGTSDAVSGEYYRRFRFFSSQVGQAPPRDDDPNSPPGVGLFADDSVPCGSVCCWKGSAVARSAAFMRRDGSTTLGTIHKSADWSVTQ